LLGGLVFGVWYPPPLYKAVGLQGIFFLLLAVDLILGPCMTLLVFKPGKPYLVLDLAVIACLQLAALSYGVWTLAEGRPAWLVFNADRFDLVRVVDLDERQIDKALEQYRRPPWLGARWVAARQPSDVQDRNQILLEAAMAGVDIYHHPERYVPLEASRAALLLKVRPLEELSRYNPPEAVHAVLLRWPKAGAWLPLMAKTLPMVVLLDRETAKVLAVADLRPWQ
jgi:hypothetical protein